MALTIAVCIGGFVWIYAQVEPFTKDFVDAATVAPTRESASRGVDDSGDNGDSNDGADENPRDNEPTDEDEPEAEPTEAPEPTQTPDGFQPTHIVTSEVPINFRPGPGVNSGDPLRTIQPGTELQYLGETQASEDPNADGDTAWLQFRDEDGLEGWIRQIDVDPVNSGQ